MRMVIDELLKGPGSWLSTRKSTGVVISSRVRLARNVANVAFPGWAGEDERVRLCGRLQGILSDLRTVSAPSVFDMATLDTIDKDVLRERHLISHELCERGRGSAVAVGAEERISVMINEEDHLRLQAMSPGLNLPAMLKELNAVDTEIEERVEYAFADGKGYLTACPSNVGTGMRASAMLHLGGLRMVGEVEPVVNGLEKMGLAVRGLLGEGTEAHGSMYQVSNQHTLGESEDEILGGLMMIIEDLIQHEQNARARLAERGATRLADAVSRARGLLLHCRILGSQEALDLLSDLRLGVEMGLVANLKIERLNEIMLLTQPGHLQKMARKILNPEERDVLRAQIVQSRLKGTSIVG
ncbi:MAG: protein arginine kinase [Verrucomicrobia bacterium]|nr:protein arginine kinase [Verrucomicrobiota bacterium]